MMNLVNNLCIIITFRIKHCTYFATEVVNPEFK